MAPRTKEVRIGRSRAKLGVLDTGVLRSEAVLQFLFKALREGTLRPGDRLREAEMAKQLKVSRTPVREAFGRLITKGLVEPAGGKGLIVRGLDPTEILDVYSVREILEGAAAGLAAKHASKAEQDLLSDLEDRFEQAAENSIEMARINGALHEAIFRAARNRFLDNALQDLQDFIALLGRTTFSVPGRALTAAREHRQIIDAIVQREPERAESAARAHIRGALLVRMQMTQNNAAAAALREFEGASS